MMIIPEKLKEADTIGLVATGRKVHPQDIASAEKHFASWGLKVLLAPHLFSDEHSYLASTDQHRLNDFQEMIDNDNIKAIICARGGYGTTRIVDRIDLSSMLQKPKWIVGFSDITALHLKLYKSGIGSIHGTMPKLFDYPGSAPSVQSLKHLLFGGPTHIDAAPYPNNRFGTTAGNVVGGNLSLLVDSLATSTEPELEGAILVMEETDEPLYKIDRMLTQLKRAGKLEKLNGLVVGHVTNSKEMLPGFGQTLEEIVLNIVRQYSYPVGFHFPIGHKDPNMAWLHGETVALTVAEGGSVMKSCAT